MAGDGRQGFRSIDTVLPRFLVMLETARSGLGGAGGVVSYSTGGPAQPWPFRRLPDAGHEIGVHSHFPGEGSGNLEHD